MGFAIGIGISPTLGQGGGLPALPAGYSYVTLNGVYVTLNGAYVILRTS